MHIIKNKVMGLIIHFLLIFQLLKKKDIKTEIQKKIKIQTVNTNNEIHQIKNWAEMFYNIKQEKSKSKFNELMSKSEYSKFFEGLNYEYGINNYTQDSQKAFDIYKEAADNTVDAMSMYKMYHIYKNEYKIKEDIYKY